MTRKKREEQREKAERRKASRRDARRRRRGERSAIRRAETELLHARCIEETKALHRVLAGEVDIADRVVPQRCRDFLSRFRWIKRKKREKFSRLIAVLLSTCPKLATREFWGPCFLLSMLSWKAEPQDWQPKGKSRHTMFCSMVDHLIVDYPVPRFLYRIFYHRSIWRHDLTLPLFFACLASGGSAYRHMKSGFMPVVMTRKMCHAFLNMPDGTAFYHAIRAAQVYALGGGRVLAGAICESPLGRRFMNDERFWLIAIKWLCENPIDDSAQIAPLIDYILEMRRRSGRYSMKGRTVKSLTRGMEAWHKELARARGLRSSVYAPAGFKPGSWRFKTKEDDGTSRCTTWTMTEILSTSELAAEGRSMSHCVLMYARSIASGRTSIWSLRCDGLRRITVRVSKEMKAVVEARGKCNRRPTPAEMNKINRWAQMNGLSIKIRY